MQTISPDRSAAIAAEVAARYGVPCKPDVVQIVPRGASSLVPQYRWDGGKLVCVETKPHGQAIREKINASYKEAARKKRVAKADQLTVPQVSAARAAAMAAQIDRTKALARERAEGIRALAALPGQTYTTIAAHMGITRDSAKKYCALYQIVPVASDNHRKAREQERLTKARAFMAAGDRTSQDLASLLGISANAAGHYIRAHGLPFRYVDRYENPTKAARRAKVAELFKAGLSASRIAAEIGESLTVVYDDCHLLDLKRKDYPLLKRAKPRTSGLDRSAMLATVAERQKKAVQLRGDGWTVKAIADHLSCGVATVMGYLERAGLTKHYSGVVGDPVMFARADAMRARKMTFREIAHHLGVGRSTVQRLLQAGRAA